MQDFFNFLLALITFDWLRQRNESKARAAAADDLYVMLMPRGECADCEDDVYFDAGERVWKHASNRQVVSRTPHGQPHAATKWLGWPRIIDAEKALGIYDPADDPTLEPAPVLTVRHGPHPKGGS